MTSSKPSKIFLRKDKQAGISPVAVSACLHRSAAGVPAHLAPSITGSESADTKKTAYEIIPKPLTVNWWNQQGSNLRPGDYESKGLYFRFFLNEPIFTPICSVLYLIFLPKTVCFCMVFHCYSCKIRAKLHCFGPDDVCHLL